MNYMEEINKRYLEIIVLKNYLNDTDYQTIREFEGGEKMSEETKQKRSDSRIRINELQAEVSELEAKLQEEEETVIPEEELL